MVTTRAVCASARGAAANAAFDAPYFAKNTTAMVTRAMLVNNTLWPHRAINSIIFNLLSLLP
jgi:hypothetical protein